MIDDIKNTGRPDSALINTQEDYEVKYWSTKFAVSARELIDAVNAVGNVATDVEAYLKKKK